MKLRIAAAVASLAACLMFVCPRADADSVYVYRKGIHLSREHPLSRNDLQILVNGLRSLTGFSEFVINNNGDLVLKDRTQFAHGSATARDLLISALDGSESLTIESANRSTEIAFAQLDSPLRYSDGPGHYFEDWRIKIDFADFKELRGDQSAIASFDPGMAFMHELAHALLGYSDPSTSTDQLGDCERYLNTVRAELGLPEREHYYPRNRLAIGLGSMSQTYYGSISFRQADGSKNNLLTISFDLGKVFDFGKARPRDVIQTELLARRSAK